MALIATNVGMAHRVMELMVVLANLASGGRHGESCALPGAALRVAVSELLVWLLFVRRLKGWANGGAMAAQRRAWRCPVVSGPHSAGDDVAVPGRTAQWRGWPHRAGSDGGDVLRWPDVTAPSWAGVG
jgi:hypothetical protein